MNLLIFSLPHKFNMIHEINSNKTQIIVLTNCQSIDSLLKKLS